MKAGVRFHIQGEDLQAALAIGPGKVALLEAIAQTGSIAAAAKMLDMSYRRAWLLVDETNRCLVNPAVETAAGGQQGGGTVLSRDGIELVERYRELERATQRAVMRKLRPLLRTLPLDSTGAAR